MKRILLLLAATSLTLSAVGIVGTKHDLRTITTGQTQVCVFCHTPHNALNDTTGPLWNHIATTTVSYTMMGGTTALASTIPSQSLACLSCHDGSVAVGSYANVTSTYIAGAWTTSGGKMTGAALVGTDLSNDHPINMAYTPAAGSLNALAVDGIHVGATAVEVFAGKVQCASCHDVHDNTNGSFLRVSNLNSALCTTCHIK